MTKVTRRSFLLIILSLLLLVGMGVFVYRLYEYGGSWAGFFEYRKFSAEVYDRNGIPLYVSDGTDGGFAEDKLVREACFQILGDYSGNVEGGILREMRNRLNRYSFLTGKFERSPLTLSLDAKLLRASQIAMRDKSGVLIFMNYKTGEILCSISAPNLDPNEFYEEPPEGAFLNKCLVSSYVPGSVFKLPSLCAALELKPSIVEEEFFCPGSMIIDGSELNCWDAHGQVDLKEAFASSCNVAFAKFIITLNKTEYEDLIRGYKVTEPFSIDGLHVSGGNFDLTDSGRIGLAWASIGQHKDLINPLGMLRFLTGVLNQGKMVTPTIIALKEDENPKFRKIMPADIADTAKAMLINNVETYYGAELFHGYEAGAKTGTAELGDDTSNSLFMGFLNSEEYPIAFICIIEGGGSGLRTAGAVVSSVLGSYLG